MDERGIAGQNERQLDLADGPPRNEHRMARTPLWVLQDRLDIERAHGRGNVVRLVANDHTSLLGGKGTARPHNVLHQCPSASPVQHLGQSGLQPGALPRGQNDDGEI